MTDTLDRRSGRNASIAPDGALLLSTLVGQSIGAADGRTLGSLQDVVVHLGRATYPGVRGLVLDHEHGVSFIPTTQLSRFNPPTALSGGAVQPFVQGSGELLIHKDLLDRALVDLSRVRVIRASDAALAEVDGQLCLVALDISTDGLARRLGPGWLTRMLSGEFVDWQALEILPSLRQAAGLTSQPGRLSDVHPADRANLVEGLDAGEGAEFIECLEDALAAAVLDEIRDDRQAALLKHLPRERAVRLLQSMQPDAAADVLDDLGEGEANALVAEIAEPKANFIREALEYPKDSAGGIMNPDFVMAFERDTVREVIEMLRARRPRSQVEWCAFVVDDEQRPRLLGTVSPQDLLAADSNDVIRDLMERSVRSVEPRQTARAAAVIMADYDLLALPVIDESGEMLGVITADDALDVLVAATRSRRES